MHNFHSPCVNSRKIVLLGDSQSHDLLFQLPDRAGSLHQNTKNTASPYYIDGSSIKL